MPHHITYQQAGVFEVLII